MAINPGEEFRIKATPSPELMRRLAYLAAQNNDSVLTGLKSSHTSYRGSGHDRARKTADALMMARLADPEYQAVSQRINNKLDLMDEASVHALQEIEQELQELRQEREKMLAQAYRDEDGKAIFMLEDESTAYYEGGSQVNSEKFTRIKDKLRGRPTWDDLQGTFRKEDELDAERDQIHGHDAARKELREDLAQGAISQEEAERREREIEESLPGRAHRSYEALASKAAGADPNRAEPSQDAPAAGSDSAGAQPAAAPCLPGTASFQPR